MDTQGCRKCGETKALTEFYAAKTGRIDTVCKECRKAGVRANRASKLDYYRAYDRKRFRELRETDPEAYRAKTMAGKNGPNVNEHKLAWRERNEEKRRAHLAVQTAKASGRLVPSETCQHCGRKPERIEAHHEDYSKPLEVLWLCRQCHARLHEARRGLETEAM